MQKPSDGATGRQPWLGARSTGGDLEGIGRALIAHNRG